MLISIENTSHQYFFQCLDEFRTDKQFCDVHIKVENETFSCHRVVLACSIPYFRSMFRTNMIESRQNEIDLRNIIDSRSFDLVLRYVYQGQIQISEKHILGLLDASVILQMDTVFQKCVSYLNRLLTVENFLSIQRFAERRSFVEIIRLIDQFVLDKFLHLKDTEMFLEFDENYLADVIDNPNLIVTSEDQVFDAVVRWLEYCPEERSQYTSLLINKVRKNDLSGNRFLENPTIENDANCKYNRLQREIISALSQSRPVNNVRRKSTSGIIFCFGGRRNFTEVLQSIEAYEWRKDRWTTVGQMNVQRCGAAVVTVGDQFYVIGGYDANQSLNSVEVYNPRTNVSTNVAPMKSRRHNFAAGFLDGFIYVAGGSDSREDVERYDVKNNVWNLLPPMNERRSRFGGATVGKYFYVIGGCNTSAILKSCERFDPNLRVWTSIAPMLQERRDAGVAVLQGKICVVGGFGNGDYLTSCERYDPELNEWIELSSMSCSRLSVGVVSSGGRLYAVGGLNHNGFLCSVEVYDPLINQWNLIADLNQGGFGTGLGCSEGFMPIFP